MLKFSTEKNLLKKILKIKSTRK